MLDSTIWLVGRCIARCGSVKTEALLNVEVLKNDMMHECMKEPLYGKGFVLTKVPGETGGGIHT